MRRIKALVLVLGVCLAGFTCCLLGVMVRQAKELREQARLSVGTDLLETAHNHGPVRSAYL